MRSLLERLSRRSPESGRHDGFAELAEWGDWVWPVGWSSAVAEGDPSLIEKSWNSIGTLAAGPIADVDRAGAIALRQWPLSVDTWFRVGERWIHPSRQSGVQQRRVDGLPIIETRARTGPAEVIFTTWADEGGGSRGRVLHSVDNRTDLPIAVATVVRPFTAVGRGRAVSMRVVGRQVIVDGMPLVELPTAAADVAGGSATNGDVHLSLADELVGGDSVSADDGSATLAAIWPLAAGSTATISVVDGRHPVESPLTPVDQVAAGWKAHLDGAAVISLPGWPDHLWASLLSGLLLRVEESSAPLGAGQALRRDDALVAAALAGSGLYDAAAIELERLLGGLTDGSVARRDWPLVGAALARSATEPATRSWSRQSAPAAAALGSLAELEVAPATSRLIARAMGWAAGPRAATDVASIDPQPAPPGMVDRLVDCGVELADEPSTPRGVDPGPVIRSAGTTWRWERDGAGDSPHARAVIADRIRRAACRETADGLDIAPGFTSAWLGRPVDVEHLPTAWGLLSFSIRWHGARPALLWEIAPLDDVEALTLTSMVIDTDFASSALAGEALLEAPEVGP